MAKKYLGRGVGNSGFIGLVARKEALALVVGAAAFVLQPGDHFAPQLASAQAAPIAATYELNITVAPGLKPAGVVIGTTGTLYLRDRASVTAPLSNVGIGASELGVGASGTDFYSEPKLSLRDRAKLTGAAILKVTPERGNDTSIAGGVVTGASFADPAGKTFLAPWPSGGGTNYDLQKGQTLTLQAGVAYGNISVKTGATLTITAGEHFVKSFTIEPGANVVLLDGTERISLFVKDSLIWRGKLSTQSGARADWLVGYLGTPTVPLEAAFSGLLIAPNAGITLATLSTGKHRGQFFGKSVEVQPDVAVEFQTSKFFKDPIATGGTLPDAHDDRCGKSSLVLSGQKKDGNVDRYSSIAQTTPTADCPLVELCESDAPGAPKLDLAALNARLSSNNTPTQACDTWGRAEAGTCRTNPATVDRTKQCNADLDCPNHATGETCVPYCVDKACTQVQHGCAKPYDCTGVDDDDPRGCDTQIAYQCTNSEDWGEPTEAEITQKVTDGVPPRTTVALAVPPADVAQVRSYYGVLTSSYCNGSTLLQQGEVNNGSEYVDPPPGSGTPSAAQEADSPIILGSERWGLFLNPRIFHKAEIGHKRLDQFNIDLEAQGSMVAGAKLLGIPITGLDVKGGAKVTQCGVDASGKFELFGETIAGLNGINTQSSACTALFDQVQKGAALLEDTVRLAQRLKKLYDGSLQGDAALQQARSFCDEVSSALDLRVNGVPVDCSTTTESAAHWANLMIRRYQNQAADYAAKRLAFFKSAIGTEADKSIPFLDLGEPFSVVGVNTAIPVGPVSIVVDAQVYGHWGLKGSIDYKLDMGSVTGTQVSGDPALSAGATFRPEVELDTSLYVGVGIELGIAGASVGLEGQLTLIKASAPVKVSMGLARVSKNETDLDPSHDYTQSDFNGTPIAGIPVGKGYTWNGQWNFGAAFNLDTLSGDLNAAARVHFLFFSKTFRAKVAHWKGISKTFPIATVGGAVPLPDVGELPANLTFNGGLDFGKFVDRVAYTQLSTLGDNNSAPFTPSDSAELTGCNVVP